MLKLLVGPRVLAYAEKNSATLHIPDSHKKQSQIHPTNKTSTYIQLTRSVISANTAIYRHFYAIYAFHNC
jgi:hypothetical protein